LNIPAKKINEYISVENYIYKYRNNFQQHSNTASVIKMGLKKVVLAMSKGVVTSYYRLNEYTRE